MKSVYQHCDEQHLHRHLAEFQFRYNHRTANGFNDRHRGQEALAGIVGSASRIRGLTSTPKKAKEQEKPKIQRWRTKHR
ncbi:hypothetical protein [Sphingomonas mucosissima]|uniref:hypothetical protein n=1 Tax=Sphingomonas mucosissima TaxID=370959 RepID=UPI000B4C03D1